QPFPFFFQHPSSFILFFTFSIHLSLVLVLINIHHFLLINIHHAFSADFRQELDAGLCPKPIHHSQDMVIPATGISSLLTVDVMRRVTDFSGLGYYTPEEIAQTLAFLAGLVLVTSKT
ncbi:hypothetical protein TGAM01_v208832, partial [Trichoderma gamsii]